MIAQVQTRAFRGIYLVRSYFLLRATSLCWWMTRQVQTRAQLGRIS